MLLCVVVCCGVLWCVVVCCGVVAVFGVVGVVGVLAAAASSAAAVAAAAVSVAVAVVAVVSGAYESVCMCTTTACTYKQIENVQTWRRGPAQNPRNYRTPVLT